MAIQVVNLEQGMPPLEVAMAKFQQSLRTAKASGFPAVKLIHGYGSSGRGGQIRESVHTALTKKKQTGQIREFVKGEEFSPFYESARRALTICQELARDRDYSQCNQGITIVVF